MLSTNRWMRLSPCSLSSAGRKSFGIMCRRCERSSLVPSFHVYMIMRIASVSSSVNQPPCRNLAIEAAKNRTWDRQEHDGEHNGAELVAAVPQVDAQQDRGGDHRDGQCQAVGAEICSESRNSSSTASVATHSTTLTTGMYSWPRVRAG